MARHPAVRFFAWLWNIIWWFWSVVVVGLVGLRLQRSVASLADDPLRVLKDWDDGAYVTLHR